MKTMSVGEFKSKFSQVLDQVKKGENIAVTYGKKKEIVAYISPELPSQGERKLGIMNGKMRVTFAPDFKMTEEEFINL